MFEHKKTIYKATQIFGDKSEDVLGYIITYKNEDEWEIAYFDTAVAKEETSLEEKHNILWLQGIKDFYEKGEDKEPFFKDSKYRYDERSLTEFLTHSNTKLRAFAKKYNVYPEN